MSRRKAPIAEVLDLRGVPCPQNAARTVLRLEGMDDGAGLDVLLDAGEPVDNVRAAVSLEGHVVLGCDALDSATPPSSFRLRIRRS
jgi:TusA-related sulfurtransferase